MSTDVVDSAKQSAVQYKDTEGQIDQETLIQYRQRYDGKGYMAK
jgi:hypothetical protein